MGNLALLSTTATYAGLDFFAVNLAKLFILAKLLFLAKLSKLFFLFKELIGLLSCALSLAT